MPTKVLEQLDELKVEGTPRADVQQGVVLQQAPQGGRQAGLPAQRAQRMRQRRPLAPLHPLEMLIKELYLTLAFQLVQSYARQSIAGMHLT